MKIILDSADREEAYRMLVAEVLRCVYRDDEIEVTMPTYSAGNVTVEIVKKPPQEQPQE